MSRLIHGFLKALFRRQADPLFELENDVLDVMAISHPHKLTVQPYGVKHSLMYTYILK